MSFDGYACYGVASSPTEFTGGAAAGLGGKTWVVRMSIAAIVGLVSMVL